MSIIISTYISGDTGYESGEDEESLDHGDGEAEKVDPDKVGNTLPDRLGGFIL